MLRVDRHGQQRSRTEELQAGLELEFLGEERGQLGLHADQDLLSLWAFGDVEGVPGHPRDELPEDLRALDLVQREDVQRREVREEAHDTIDAAGGVLEVLHVPRCEAEGLGHQADSCMSRAWTGVGSFLSPAGSPATYRFREIPHPNPHKARQGSKQKLLEADPVRAPSVRMIFEDYVVPDAGDPPGRLRGPQLA